MTPNNSYLSAWWSFMPSYKPLPSSWGWAEWLLLKNRIQKKHGMSLPGLFTKDSDFHLAASLCLPLILFLPLSPSLFFLFFVSTYLHLSLSLSFSECCISFSLACHLSCCELPCGETHMARNWGPQTYSLQDFGRNPANSHVSEGGNPWSSRQALTWLYSPWRYDCSLGQTLSWSLSCI